MQNQLNSDNRFGVHHHHRHHQWYSYQTFWRIYSLTSRRKDNFINLAKQGYAAYNQSQQSQSHGSNDNDNCKRSLLSISSAIIPFDSIRTTFTQPNIARPVARNTTLLTTLSKEAAALNVLSLFTFGA